MDPHQQQFWYGAGGAFMESATLASECWTREEDKIFENALLIYPEWMPNRWELISKQVAGKSAAAIEEHHAALMHDLTAIHSGRVELPTYVEDYLVDLVDIPSDLGEVEMSLSATENKREPPKFWSNEEHREFLRGVMIMGWGNWKLMSKEIVPTKTPSQIASHAQKYALRHRSGDGVSQERKRKRKRVSIHDITGIDDHPNAAVVLPPPHAYRHSSTATQSSTRHECSYIQSVATVLPPPCANHLFGTAANLHPGMSATQMALPLPPLYM